MNLMDIQQMRAELIRTSSSTNYVSPHEAISRDDAPDRNQLIATVDKHETIRFSDEALDALNKSVITDAIDTFLTENGERLYEMAIKSLKTYPEDLIVKIEDKSLAEKERTELIKARNEQELNAFGKYAKQSPPDYKMYYEKYIEYLDSLSPEEQQSNRYRGQRALVVPIYERLAREQGENPADMSRVQDTILGLFDLIAEFDFKIENVEDFRKHYNEVIAPMFKRDSGPRFKEDADRALERFDAVQSVLGAAREANETAFQQLQKLVDGVVKIDEFMSYAERFAQIEPA